jgi:hypothetical protein
MILAPPTSNLVEFKAATALIDSPSRSEHDQLSSGHV